MEKFNNKYRIESARLNGWDYRNSGAYFITICTGDKIHHFGECKDGRMRLSTMGLIVQGCWYEIPRLNQHVQLGAFIVMPNHTHGILILDNDKLTNVSQKTKIESSDKNDFFQKISSKSGSVSRMIQQYKRACTYHIRCTFTNADFYWQTRFHEHIIRDVESFDNIHNYILNNPFKWDKDKFNEA